MEKKVDKSYELGKERADDDLIERTLGHVPDTFIIPPALDIPILTYHLNHRFPFFYWLCPQSCGKRNRLRFTLIEPLSPELNSRDS